jgi:four helix bundle protein
MTETAQKSSYKNLIVYQKAKQLTLDIIRYFSKYRLPKTKEFLIGQLFRSVNSIGANLAEGYGRHYQGSFRQFIGIARGSAFETDYWLETILDLGNFDRKILSNFIEKNIEICKMLTGLMAKTNKKS